MAERRFNFETSSRKKIKLSTFDQKRNADWGSAAEKQEAEAVLQKMESAYKTLISCVGKDDSVRSSLEKTPLRAAKALCYFTKGYEEDVASQSYYELLERREGERGGGEGWKGGRGSSLISCHHVLGFRSG